MTWLDVWPRLTRVRKVEISDTSLNLIYYAFHVPLIAYVVYVLVLQKQYTIIIDNSPTVLLKTDVIGNAHFLNADPMPPDAATVQWCANGGGPFPCNSTPEIFQECAPRPGVSCLVNPLYDTASIFKSPTEVSILNLDVVQQVDLRLNKACSRACPLPVDILCLIPAQTISQTGSAVMEVVTFNAFMLGNLQTGQINPDLWVLLHHLVRVLPISLTYSFQLAETPPYFFGQVPGVADRKSNLVAHTIGLDPQNQVMYSYKPGVDIALTLTDFVALAGHELDLNMLLNGAEFSVTVNCYNDALDLPPLVWTGLDSVIPSTRVPLCLVTAQLLRNSSVVKVAEQTFAGVRASIRVDTQQGSSFFRLPSLTELVLSLISVLVLLQFPTNLTATVASTCFGQVSRIFKEAQLERFNIDLRVPSLTLRLVSDRGNLIKLRSWHAHLQPVVRKMKPSLASTVPDLIDHIFQGATLDESLAATYQMQELCAYFDRSCCQRLLAPSLKGLEGDDEKEPEEKKEPTEGTEDEAKVRGRMAEALTFSFIAKETCLQAAGVHPTC